MKALLQGLLPRIFPKLDFLCVAHEGKIDLERSIPRKLRGWRSPGDRFVVVRDNDSLDCHVLKERIHTLIRIVCQELEAWYLGEPDAMADAFGDDNLRRIGNRARYRNPDICRKPSEDVKKLSPRFQKVEGARSMAAHLTQEGNSSHSFAVFLSGVGGLGADAV